MRKRKRLLNNKYQRQNRDCINLQMKITLSFIIYAPFRMVSVIVALHVNYSPNDQKLQRLSKLIAEFFLSLRPLLIWLFLCISINTFSFIIFKFVVVFFVNNFMLVHWYLLLLPFSNAAFYQLKSDRDHTWQFYGEKKKSNHSFCPHWILFWICT